MKVKRLTRLGLAVTAASMSLTYPNRTVRAQLPPMLVIEKTTGQVKRVIDGTVTATVLDLADNAASERAPRHRGSSGMATP
jgi:hypothetical protein